MVSDLHRASHGGHGQGLGPQHKDSTGSVFKEFLVWLGEQVRQLGMKL